MKRVFLIVSLLWAPAALAQTPLPRLPIEPRLEDRMVTLDGDITLDVLLSAEFDIIHIDAPAGSLSARFILQKDAKIFSCEPMVYRDGGARGGARVVAGSCIDLTP